MGSSPSLQLHLKLELKKQSEYADTMSKSQEETGFLVGSTDFAERVKKKA